MSLLVAVHRVTLWGPCLVFHFLNSLMTVEFRERFLLGLIEAFIRMTVISPKANEWIYSPLLDRSFLLFAFDDEFYLTRASSQCKIKKYYPYFNFRLSTDEKKPAEPELLIHARGNPRPPPLNVLFFIFLNCFNSTPKSSKLRDSKELFPEEVGDLTNPFLRRSLPRINFTLISAPPPFLGPRRSQFNSSSTSP